MKSSKFTVVLIALIGLMSTFNQFASAEAIWTGPITLSDHGGLGVDLSAAIIGGHSQHSAGYIANRAFDGNHLTDWATLGGSGNFVLMDIDLTSGAPGGAQVGALSWFNRYAPVDYVQSMNVILSPDDTLGNGDDITVGPIDVSVLRSSVEFTPVTAKRVRLQSLAAVGNPGAMEIGLFAERVVNPVTLYNFSGPGQDLNADLIGFHSEFNDLRAISAFDGNTGTQWADQNGYGNRLTLDLRLTRDAPLGVMLEGFVWQNRAGGGGDEVLTMEVILSEDDIFDGGDTILGPFNVDGDDADSYTFGTPTFANYVRFHALTSGNPGAGHPGAVEIELFGTLVPEPATMSLLVLGGLGVLARRKRRA